MRELAAILFILLNMNPYVTLDQENGTLVATKPQPAAQFADDFVERFHKSLDFGVVWGAFRLSERSCTHRANGILDEGDQQSEPRIKPHPACGVIEVGHSRPQKPPVIFGKPYLVPKFRLLITDEQTGAPIAGREVIVRYVWRWFEYPYPERPLGVWSDSYDLVRCTSDNNGEVEMSEFKVVPSGWYKGKMLMGREPEFTHLDVSVHLEKQITHVRLTKVDLERHRRKKADTIPLQISPISRLPK
jgi:hypothetical protein